MLNREKCNACRVFLFEAMKAISKSVQRCVLINPIFRHMFHRSRGPGSIAGLGWHEKLTHILKHASFTSALC